MITIYYCYFSKSANKWLESEKEFYDLIKAFRFAMKCKTNTTLYLLGWNTTEPSWNEYLCKRL